jgi:hypothetical protein
MTDAELAQMAGGHFDPDSPEWPNAIRLAQEVAAAMDASWRARHAAAMARVDALQRTSPHPATDDLTWNAAVSAVKGAIRGTR